MKYKVGSVEKGIMIIRQKDLKELNEISYQIGWRTGVVKSELELWGVETDDIIRREQAKHITEVMAELSDWQDKLDQKIRDMGL